MTRTSIRLHGSVADLSANDLIWFSKYIRVFRFEFTPLLARIYIVLFLLRFNKDHAGIDSSNANSSHWHQRASLFASSTNLGKLVVSPPHGTSSLIAK